MELTYLFLLLFVLQCWRERRALWRYATGKEDARALIHGMRERSPIVSGRRLREEERERERWLTDARRDRP